MHIRKAIRLQGHDYTDSRVYFVTICTHERQCVFGEVIGDTVRLSVLGKIVDEEICRTPLIRPNVGIDTYVVMPNHVHVVFDISDDSSRATHRVAPTKTQRSKGPSRGSLGAVVGQIKSAVTRRYATIDSNTNRLIWQRGYFDRIVRSMTELNAIRMYIAANPATWNLDSLHTSDA